MEMKKDKIFYYLTIEDIQDVANEQLGRDLSPNEIEQIKDKIAEKVNWYDAIAYTIMENITPGVVSKSDLTIEVSE